VLPGTIGFVDSVNAFCRWFRHKLMQHFLEMSVPTTELLTILQLSTTQTKLFRVFMLAKYQQEGNTGAYGKGVRHGGVEGNDGAKTKLLLANAPLQRGTACT
jgi:hypothetical protein